MSKFFVPTSWENLVDAIKFRPIRSTGAGAVSGVNGNGNAAVSGAKINKNKVKTRPIKKANEGNEMDGAAPPSSKQATSAKATKTAVVQNGHIGKSKKKAKRKQHQLAPALAKVLTNSDDFNEEICSEKKTKKKKQIKTKQSVTMKAGDDALSAGEGETIAEPNEEMDASSEDEEADQNMLPVPDKPGEENEEEKDFGLSVFESKLREQLLGGRFRYINEQLYNMDSQEAKEFFENETNAFNEYHAGYQQQVQNWPLNPLDRIIKIIRKLPKSLEIADLGCGEARLASSVPNKVYSMDLVSANSQVIACDMANTPLKEQSVDVVVYCLSLMGTNLTDYLLEANRVLRLYGLVLIAEIQSRFDDLRQFLRGLEACGFELVKKDISAGLFYFFQFKKVRNVSKVATLPAFSLKPCLYRKR